MNLIISPLHRAARLSGGGTQGFADLGPLNSRIRFYSTSQPAFGESAGGAALVELVLAKPCGELVSAASLGIVDGVGAPVEGDVLRLLQLDPAGDQIPIEGDVVWGRWINGADEIVADGDASDALG